MSAPSVASVFESEPCPRCGGTGKHSYNAVHRDVCYGCRGEGRRLTKRGGAAWRFYLDSITTSWGQVRVGDRLRYEDIASSYVVTVVRIEPFTDAKFQGCVQIGLRRERDGSVFMLNVYQVGSGRVRRVPSADEAPRLRDAALAFQASLRKDGKPRKVRGSGGAR